MPPAKIHEVGGHTLFATEIVREQRHTPFAPDVVRERRGAYGGTLPRPDAWSENPPDEAPHLVAGRALIAIRGLCLARAAIRCHEASHFEFLFRTHAHRDFGFASFGDFSREVLQTSPRSARRHIALHRLATTSPFVAQALRVGSLTPCQALVLKPLVGVEDLEPWADRAASCSVADLQKAVTTHLARMAEGPISDSRHLPTLPATDPPDISEEESGRRVTFAAPFSAALAWSHGIEWARRVLGWEAPQYHCVEAILSEAASELIYLDEPPPLSVVEQEPRTSTVRPAPNGSSGEGANGGSPGMPDFPENGPRAPATLDVPPIPRSKRTALCSSIRDAARMLSGLAAHERPPTHPRDSVALLRTFRVEERSLRLLLVRLIRDLESARLTGTLGYTSVRHFLIDGLKLSERTAARFLTEAWLFEDNEALRQAFRDGEVGLGQAYLIDRVATRSTILSFIHRAQSVTHLHFEREVQFLERLDEYLPSIAQRFRGPLPLPGLEEALGQRLRDLGWTDETIEAEICAYFLRTAEEMSPPAQDPAINIMVLRRLEALLEILVLALEEQDVRGTVTSGSRSNVLPTLAADCRTTISFWAPQSIIDYWERALTAVRRQFGPLPAWAAATILLEAALREWRQIDPSVRRSQTRVQE